MSAPIRLRAALVVVVLAAAAGVLALKGDSASGEGGAQALASGAAPASSLDGAANPADPSAGAPAPGENLEAGAPRPEGAAPSPEPASAGRPAATAAAPPLPKLLDLGAGKCIPCKRMMPILAELEETFAGVLEVEFIDVWENPDAAKPWGVRLIPTQIFLDPEGKELFRHEGFFPREDILAQWKRLGYDLESVATKAGGGT